MIVQLIESVYNLLWGDLLTLPLGNATFSLSLMVILLFTAGIYFTLRTRLLPVRLFRKMIAAVCEKNQNEKGAFPSRRWWCPRLPGWAWATLWGVVAAVSMGGAGAIFWMWVTALLGASTSFVESTLAQKYKQPDPLYGRLPGRSGLLPARAGSAQAGQKAAPLGGGLAVCPLRPHLLVRHQPGHQQLGEAKPLQMHSPSRRW